MKNKTHYKIIQYSISYWLFNSNIYFYNSNRRIHIEHELNFYYIKLLKDLYEKF
jgi:hypothetical protein